MTRDVRDRDRHPLVNVAGLLLFALVTGLVVALGAMPSVAGGGYLAKRGADSFQDLPSNLTIPPSPQNSYLYAADGKTLITAFYEENRRDVTQAEIPQVMRQAIVAAEDNRFYQHHGVDMHGVLRSLVANNSSGDVQQGASTLTMQYVRNVLVDTAQGPEQIRQATEQTPARKLREMRYALALEKKLSKDEILRRYLNIALFGHHAYGIYAAAQTYFSVTPAQLTLPQATMLAGLVQSPNDYDPTQPDQRPATNRRNYVLDRMVAMHDIDAHQAATAKATPIGLKPTAVPNGCVAVPDAHPDWGFFCDYFTRWWQSQPAFGTSTQERMDRLRRGGYSIVTSLEPNVQQIAENRVVQQAATTNPFAISMAVVQPGSGKILAMATNRHYSLDTTNNLPSTVLAGQRGNYPNTTNPLISGGDGIYGYQAGSTFKMFTMLAALSIGRNLSTTFDAPAQLTTSFPDDGPASCSNHHWCPKNASPSWMDGKRTMWNGFGRSVNTYFAWLEQSIGADRAVAMAKRLGIQFRAPSDAELADNEASKWGAFTLGVAAVTPLDLANAYATVAADGKYCQPQPVLAVTDRSGAKLPVGGPVCSQVLGPEVARAATDAARCPVWQQSYYAKCDGGTTPNGFGNVVGRPFAGKTGTVDYSTSATFAGYTPQFAGAAIAADPDNPRHGVSDDYAERVDLAVARTIHDASAGLPVVYFGKPSASIAGTAVKPAPTTKHR